MLDIHSYPVSLQVDDNPRITGYSTARLDQNKMVRQKYTAFFVLGPKQAALFGLAGPKLDADQTALKNVGPSRV